MKWLKKRKQNEETRWTELETDIDTFRFYLVAFIIEDIYSRYAVDCFTEQNTKYHEMLAEMTLIALRDIKDDDIGAYKTIVYLYEEDIQKAIIVYRGSKKKA